MIGDSQIADQAGRLIHLIIRCRGIEDFGHIVPVIAFVEDRLEGLTVPGVGNNTFGGGGIPMVAHYLGKGRIDAARICRLAADLRGEFIVRILLVPFRLDQPGVRRIGQRQPRAIEIQKKIPTLVILRDGFRQCRTASDEGQRSVLCLHFLEECNAVVRRQIVEIAAQGIGLDRGQTLGCSDEEIATAFQMVQIAQGNGRQGGIETIARQGFTADDPLVAVQKFQKIGCDNVLVTCCRCSHHHQQ